MPQLAINKRAKFDYEIQEKYEAGLVLFGHEVKAARAGQISLKGSYISVRTKNGRPELYLINCQISPYKNAGLMLHYDQYRERKLLLKKKEINYLLGKKLAEGLTLIPLKIYTNHSFLKLEFAVAKGKKKYDKRETIKKRDVERRLRTLTKRG
ncbi:SsrA-binding protein SmpB [Candidatus Falkowbacteria bacterium]|jgi:SsrA-binding protein|nr:SsrA-binding protein SmpB [Candidatus Falkowbacteria bacterium]